jgi:hypothetical protein
MMTLASLLQTHKNMPIAAFDKLIIDQYVRLSSLHSEQVHITYTPMIVAGTFVASQSARDSDFTTCAEDTPLVAQFAAKTPDEFASAAGLRWERRNRLIVVLLLLLSSSLLLFLFLLLLLFL